MSIYSSVRNAVRLGTVEALNQSGYTNVPVIYSHQNGAEPSAAYVVIQIVSLAQIGSSQEDTLTDESSPERKITYKSYYEGTIQFTFAGSAAPDMAHEFLNAIPGNIVVRESYQRNNLAPIRKSTLRRAPQKRDTGWVEFINLDVTFSYAVKTTQTVDWVEHITLLDDFSGDVITIPPIESQTLLTESGDEILTEGGDNLVTEG